MKKVLISLSIIAAAAAIIIGGTTAFFSDTETSIGNTFTAGAIDLKVDSNASYNGQSVAGSTWALKDLANLENGQTEPEALVDITTGTNEGELQNALVMTIWRDDGAGIGGIAGDNIQNGTEQTLAFGHPVNGVLPVYDSTTGTGALVGGTIGYLGVKWELPLATDNEVQTDSLTGDISFNVVQSRNNADFRCVPEPIVFVYNQQSAGDNENISGETAMAGTRDLGYDQPYVTWVINGDNIDFTFYNPTPFLFVFDYRVDSAAGVARNQSGPDLTNVAIGGGPLVGQLFGETYNRVVLSGNSSQMVNVVGNSIIEVGLREGAENDWYIDWLIFLAN